MKITIDDLRRDALARYINRLSPNLLRAYVLDNLIADAGPEAIDKLVVAFQAGHAVPPKGT